MTGESIGFSASAGSLASPFRRQGAAPLAPGKFVDPHTTAQGERRAAVTLGALETLWFNTGSLCNIACATCFMESSPRNDLLAYLSAADVARYLDEIAALGEPTRLIGFTGGEPFMNREFPLMLSDALARGHNVLVLTNAMAPLRQRRRDVAALVARHGARLTFRVSLDHYTPAAHEAERGADTFAPAIEGLRWLSDAGASIAAAGRRLDTETDALARAGYQTLFDGHGVRIDARDPTRLVLFPNMDASADVPEITDACWQILDLDPASLMCASSRMVVRRKGATAPSIAACTLLPYDERFDLGPTLAGASRTVALNHPHCARFCALGGASCAA